MRSLVGEKSSESLPSSIQNPQTSPRPSLLGLQFRSSKAPEPLKMSVQDIQSQHNWFLLDVFYRITIFAFSETACKRANKKKALCKSLRCYKSSKTLPSHIQKSQTSPGPSIPRPPFWAPSSGLALWNLHKSENLEYQIFVRCPLRNHYFLHLEGPQQRLHRWKKSHVKGKPTQRTRSRHKKAI